MINKYQTNPIINRRSILVVALIVVSMTAGNLLLHRGDPKVGYARYEEFGFTLDYSQKMTLREEGFGGQEVKESGGTVQVSYQGNRVEQYGVLWISPMGMPTHMRGLEGAMEYLFAVASMEGTTFSDLGTTKSTVHNGHEMIYQSFNLVEQGIDVPGIMGGVNCEDSGQFFWFYFIYLPDLENPTVDTHELEQGWLGYLDGFRCHV